MVKRTATEWKRKGIEGCSYFLMEETAAQNTKIFHSIEYNFRDYAEIKGKRADIREILVPDATHSLGGIITGWV